MQRPVSRLGLPSLLAAAAVGACDCGEELHVIPGDLVGTVCAEESGRGLEGANVVLVDKNGEEHSATTDAQGVFRIDDAAPGQGELTVEGEGGTRTFDVRIESETEVAFRDAYCRPPPPPPTGSVAGCVCDQEKGQWVEGANVFVNTPAGEVVVTGTASDGCFLLEGVPVGPAVVKIQKEQFYTEQMVDVQEGAVAELPPVENCALPPPPPPPEGSGTVEGRVCAPDGSTWLADATVWVELPDGTRVETTTDGDGNYSLVGVPPGTQTLHIQKGSFSTTVIVEVPEDGVVTLPEADCAIQQDDLRIAVVSGAWDNVRQVLVSVGVDPATITDYEGEPGGFFGTEPSEWAGQLLGDYATLAQYDIVFLNCGLDDVSYLDSPTYAANLRQFVSEGGSLYVSDQAYDIVEATFPDFIDFYDEDTMPQSAQKGAAADNIIGTVSDPALSASLGAQTIELHYPLLAWAVMQSVTDDVRVYIRGDAPVSGGQTLDEVPHTVGFQVGEGKVIYTSFHQEPGIAVMQERVLQLLVFEL